MNLTRITSPTSRALLLALLFAVAAPSAIAAPDSANSCGGSPYSYNQSTGTYGNNGYKPLQAGPPQGGPSTAWPSRNNQRTSGQPLSPPLAPSRFNQSYGQQSTSSNSYASPEGQDIEQSVLNAGWAKAKARDAQGVPGSVRANPNEQPPVAEDKANMTPLEKSKLAYWYWKTERVSKLPRAVQLMTEAAEAGDSRSQAVLADWYTRGIRETLPVDDTKALYWNQKAAAAGQRVAQLALGDNYYNGLCVQKNYKTAFEWFMKAAQQNFPTAELAVAQAYCTGEGVAENRSEALRWFNKSKADGCTSAQNFLDVLNLPGCPAHFSSLNELMSYGNRYERLESANQIYRLQAASGQGRMLNSQPGSQEHREGEQQYSRAQQGINNTNNALNGYTH